jgi:hypothetical protein
VEEKTEREREREKCLARERKRESNRGVTEEEGGGLDFPKDLCVILENCRDLFVKQKFPVDLKP